MRRGRPSKFRDPARRPVTAEKLTFEILSSLGYDYSEVFEEGRRAILKHQLVDTIYPNRVGMFKISRMDILIQDLDNEIEALTEIKKLLEDTRAAQTDLLTFPEGERERQIIFGELASKHLAEGEIRGYYDAFCKRIDRGETGQAIVKSVLDDLESRCNGSGEILADIKKEDSIYRENLVWNFLSEAVKS